MSVTVKERGNRRSGDANSRQIDYVIRGTTSDSEAFDEFLLQTSTIWDSRLPRNGATIEQVAYDTWYGTLTYSLGEGGSGDPEPLPQGSIEYQWDVTGNTTRITHGYAHRKYGANSEDYSGGILHKEDGTFEGVDVFTPTSSFAYIFKPLSTFLITDAYIRSVEAIAYTVNAAPWRSRAAGELLFLGCNGSIDTAGNKTLNFKFNRRVNVTGDTIGDITGIDKLGWEYLWVDYKKAPGDNKLTAEPMGVYVHQVYRTSNFTTVLGF